MGKLTFHTGDTKCSNRTKCLSAKVETTLWKFIYLGSNACTRKRNYVSRESTQEMNLASQKLTMVILLKSKSIEQSLVCPFTLTLWPKQNKKKIKISVCCHYNRFFTQRQDSMIRAARMNFCPILVNTMIRIFSNQDS